MINPYGNLADSKVCSLFLGTRKSVGLGKAKFSSINEFKYKGVVIDKEILSLGMS